jgi:hypothetical protein
MDTSFRTAHCIQHNRHESVTHLGRFSRIPVLARDFNGVFSDTYGTLQVT